MKSLLILHLMIVFTPYATSICTSTTRPSSFVPINQYSNGMYNSTVLFHVLSSSNVDAASFNSSSISIIYSLSASSVSSASTECPSDCLLPLTPIYFANSSTISVVMVRPDDDLLYTNYIPPSPSPPPVYCVQTSGDCGATIPLYLYYSSTYLDYYVSTGAASDVSSTDYSIQMMGMALCYTWVDNSTTTTSTTTTTTTTTTTVSNMTTTTAFETNSSTTFFSTTTTIPSNMTTTTVWNTTTTTTTPETNTTQSSNSTITTTTVASTNNTTSSTGTSSTTLQTNSTTSKSQHRHRDHIPRAWRWVLIVVGVVVSASLLMAAVGWLTCSFIAASKRPAVRPYTNGYPADTSLPPQPMQAAPSPQPFSVGNNMPPISNMYY